MEAISFVFSLPVGIRSTWHRCTRLTATANCTLKIHLSTDIRKYGPQSALPHLLTQCTCLSPYLSSTIYPALKQSPSHLQLLARDDLSQRKNPFTMCALEQLPDNAWQIRVTSVMNLS